MTRRRTPMRAAALVAVLLAAAFPSLPAPPARAASVVEFAPHPFVPGKDYTAELQDAVTKANGGRVHIAAGGPYVVGTIHILVAGTVIAGDGAASTRLRMKDGNVDASGYSCSVFDVRASRVTIRDLSIDGNASKQHGKASGGHVIQFASSWRTSTSAPHPVTWGLVDSVAISNCSSAAVEITESSDHTMVRRCRFDGNDHAVELNSSAYCTVEGNVCSGSRLETLVSYARKDKPGTARNNAFIGNTVTRSAWGVSLQRSFYDVVRGNTVTGCPDWGIQIHAEGLDKGSWGHVIEGNTVTASGFDGITIEQPASRIVIRGNKVSGSRNAGIRVLDGFSDSIISGNTLTDNVKGVAGRSASTWTRVAVVDNAFSGGRQTASIDVETGSAVALVHNVTPSGTRARAPASPVGTRFSLPSPGGSGTSTFACVLNGNPGRWEGVLGRVQGADRYETAIGVSRNGWAGGTADGVVLASGQSYAGALSGAALAGVVHGPLLLTPADVAPPGLVAEVRRVLKPGVRRVYLMGGTAEVSESVLRAVAASGFDVERIAGAGAAGTAASAAAKVRALAGSARTTVFVATASGYADGLAAAPYSAALGAPLLLVPPGGILPPEVAGAVRACGATRVYVIGGPDSVSPAVASQLTTLPGVVSVKRLAGEDRYATCAAVAAAALANRWASGGYTALACGASFPDALAAGPLVARDGGSLALVPAAGTLPSGTRALLRSIDDVVTHADVLGSERSVSAGMAAQARMALALP